MLINAEVDKNEGDEVQLKITEVEALLFTEGSEEFKIWYILLHKKHKSRRKIKLQMETKMMLHQKFWRDR